MSRDNRGESCCFWFQIQVCDAVQNVNGDPACFQHFIFWQFPCPRLTIYVPSHHSKGSDRVQLLRNFGISDVARVNDVIRSPQWGYRFGSQQTMRIRDYTDYDLG